MCGSLAGRGLRTAYCIQLIANTQRRSQGSNLYVKVLYAITPQIDVSYNKMAFWHHYEKYVNTFLFHSLRQSGFNYARKLP